MCDVLRISSSYRFWSNLSPSLLPSSFHLRQFKAGSSSHGSAPLLTSGTGTSSWIHIWRVLLAVRGSWLFFMSLRRQPTRNWLILHPTFAASSNQPSCACRGENNKWWIGPIRDKTLSTQTINAWPCLCWAMVFRRFCVGLHDSPNAICVIHQWVIVESRGIVIGVWNPESFHLYAHSAGEKIDHCSAREKLCSSDSEAIWKLPHTLITPFPITWYVQQRLRYSLPWLCMSHTSRFKVALRSCVFGCLLQHPNLSCDERLSIPVSLNFVSARENGCYSPSLGTPREIGASVLAFAGLLHNSFPASRTVGQGNLSHGPTSCQRISGMGNIMQAPCFTISMRYENGILWHFLLRNLESLIFNYIQHQLVFIKR